MNVLYKKATDLFTEKVVEINKAVGSLTIYTSKKLDELVNEKINIQIQRANGGDNIEITNGNVPLKEFLVLASMQEDAIGASKAMKMEVQATVELTEHDATAIHLYEKDILKVTLVGMDAAAEYIIDANESPLTTDDIYTYNRKSMNSEHENMDFDVTGFDACTITDKASIYEINLRFENGAVVKTNSRELRAQGEALDPIAQVCMDGTVVPSFEDLLQLPLKGVVSINIRKTQGDIVSLLMRHDQEMKELNY
jgi:hypothetical protein